MTLQCMIKPFTWQYPCFIYSKDPYLLESPFPIIAGVSRQLFLKNSQDELDKDDRFVFDLERGEVYFDKESLEKIKFIEDIERCEKIKNNHCAFFNDAESHIFELDDGIVVPHHEKGLREELPSEFLEPEHAELHLYFSQFRKVISSSLVEPLLGSSTAVNTNFY